MKKRPGFYARFVLRAEGQVEALSSMYKGTQEAEEILEEIDSEAELQLEDLHEETDVF
jgi:hypothetical protein